MKDDDVTWVLTKIKLYFYLGFWEVKNTIPYSENCLREL